MCIFFFSRVPARLPVLTVAVPVLVARGLHGAGIQRKVIRRILIFSYTFGIEWIK